jgi:hypothetical protein
MAWHRMDDLDGTPAQQTTFGLDGKVYTIDLGEANRAKLEKALRPFLAVAQVYAEMPLAPGMEVPLTVAAPGDEEDPVPPPTPAPRVAKARGPRGKQSSAVAQSTIRQWATENGYQVSDRGRIPDAVMNAYTEAHA